MSFEIPRVNADAILAEKMNRALQDLAGKAPDVLAYVELTALEAITVIQLLTLRTAIRGAVQST